MFGGSSRDRSGAVEIGWAQATSNAVKDTPVMRKSVFIEVSPRVAAT
jgi:hypothetical protein